jgi:hypothetical protein
MVTCVECFEDKEESEFTLRSSICKKCKRQKNLSSTYGISTKTYAKMYNDQKGCCAICGKHESEFKRSLCVDHCHTTLKVRNLLCMKCNSALGLLNEDEDTVTSMLSYIREHK